MARLHLNPACVAGAALLTVLVGDGIGAARPNIVYILADDMGYSDMGSQGAAIDTPNLDRLRAEGMYLTRNYAQPQCSPTRVALLTGRYPYRFGLHEHIVLSQSLNGVPGETTTVAEKLQEAGYRTAIIGKWHVGGRMASYLPHNQGFDRSTVCINGAISYWNYTHTQRSDVIRNGEKVYARSMENNESSGNTYATDLWKQEAVEVVSGHDINRPLFLFLSFTAPHFPLHAPKALVDKYQDREIDAYWSAPGAAKGRTAGDRRRYMAMVDSMDSAIGALLAALDAKGMLKNTLIVFSSDNGGIPQADNRPLRSNKGDSFEGGIRVPGIAYWPGQIAPGSESSELVYAADWFPTFAEVAGLSVASDGLDGVSALRLLRGGVGLREAVPIISAGRHAYVTKDWSLVGGGEDYQQLVRNGLSRFELYDLQADASQAQSTTDHPEQADALRQAFLPHFRDIHRGYFNWDIRYSRGRSRDRSEDHNLDMVTDDQPQLDITRTGRNAHAVISPVRKGLTYRLQQTLGGVAWKDIDRFVCRQDGPRHRFGLTASPADTARFRVVAELNYGLPLRDPFSLNNAYKPGVICEDERAIEREGLLPRIDGFHPAADVIGGRDVEVIADSLRYPGRPEVGGALRLRNRGSLPETVFTRYLAAPQNRGKVFASMLVRFEGFEPECSAKICWLRQNGWNGPVAPAVGLSLEPDGVYLEQADTLEETGGQRLAPYGGGVVCLLLEFELGTTGSDTLKIHIDPKARLDESTCRVSLTGEFTFDRLQFKLTGRPGSLLEVDDIRVGTTLADVLGRGETIVQQ